MEKRCGATAIKEIVLFENKKKKRKSAHEPFRKTGK